MAEPKEGLPVTPAVVRWARERAGYSLEDATHYFKKIAAWESGEALPSYPQLEQMAEKFKCPVATFFFPKPPALPPIEKSFRTLATQDFADIPRTVGVFLRRAQAMQINLSELSDGKNRAPRVITRDLKFSTSTPLDQIAAAVRAYLGVTIDEQVKWRSVDSAFENWRDLFIERSGVYVFKDAFHAPSYFGFCLYDEEFPIIYVNNSSAKARQIFTLFHELGHLLFHTSGVDLKDDPFIEHLGGDAKRIEIICNGLAARVLVPDEVLDPMLKGLKADRQSAARLADHFKVSREVIYRKMLDRDLIAADEYAAAATEWSAPHRRETEGGSWYNNHHAYLGQRYIDLAFSRYHQKRFDESKLARYLNIKPRNLPTFEARFGFGGL